MKICVTNTIRNIYIYVCTFIYLTFHSFDLERTRWRLYQNHIVHTKLYIYLSISVYYLTDSHGFSWTKNVELWSLPIRDQSSKWCWFTNNNYVVPIRPMLSWLYLYVDAYYNYYSIWHLLLLRSLLIQHLSLEK